MLDIVIMSFSYCILGNFRGEMISLFSLICICRYHYTYDIINLRNQKTITIAKNQNLHHDYDKTITVHWDIFDAQNFQVWVPFTDKFSRMAIYNNVFLYFYRWPSLKIYLQKGPILENFVYQKFPNTR